MNIKDLARSEVAKAVRRGSLERPDKCQKCNGVGPVEAHHFDYNKAFDVFWVCRKCHRLIHRILNSFENTYHFYETCKKHGANPSDFASKKRPWIADPNLVSIFYSTIAWEELELRRIEERDKQASLRHLERLKEDIKAYKEGTYYAPEPE